MKPLLHAERSAKKYGGRAENYLPIHDFMDSTKSSLGDVRHRAILHNAFGIFLAEKVFGTYITIDYDENGLYHEFGKKVSVRDIAEDHVVEDVGYIPSLQDWLKNLPVEDWMMGKAQPSIVRAEDPAELAMDGASEKFYQLANSDGVSAAQRLDISPGVPVTAWDDSYVPTTNGVISAVVTPTSEDYLAQVEKYKELKKEMSKSAKDVLLNAAKVVFATIPEAVEIRWLQFTPYFNDGDACTFNVHEPFFVTQEEIDDDDPSYSDETGSSVLRRIAYCQRKHEQDPDRAYWNESAAESIKEAEEKWGDKAKDYIEAWSKFDNVFYAMDDDFMLDAFGDHVLVKINRDGTYVEEEHEHD